MRKNTLSQALRRLSCALCTLLCAVNTMYAQADKASDNGSSASAKSVKEAVTAPQKQTMPLYVKTNAVAWALLITNIEVETDIKPHLSADLDMNCSTWNYFSARSKYRVLSVYPAVRYWLDASNNGVFFDVHIGIASYNFASSGKYRIQDHNGNSPAIGMGVSAGYRMAISRNGRWLAEACLGAGVYGLHYDKFYNQPGGLRASTTKRTGICIDHLSLSLCYRFDLKKGK